MKRKEYRGTSKTDLLLVVFLCEGVSIARYQRLDESIYFVESYYFYFKKPLIMVHVHALFAVITRLTLLSSLAFAHLTLTFDGM